MVVGVGDEQHTARTHRHGVRRRKHGRRAIARDRRDRAVSRDPSHTVVPGVGDVYVAGRIEGKTRGQVQIRRGGWTAVAAKCRSATPGEREDVAAMIDPSYPVIVRVGDEEAPIRRYRDSD